MDFIHEFDQPYERGLLEKITQSKKDYVIRLRNHFIQIIQNQEGYKIYKDAFAEGYGEYDEPNLVKHMRYNEQKLNRNDSDHQNTIPAAVVGAGLFWQGE
jgi:hypothetical protein